MTHVAVDVLGDDLEPNVPVPGEVLDGLLSALDDDGELRLVIVGPAAALADALAERGVAPGDRVRLADGPEFVGAFDDPARAVRARRLASIRVAARLVRDGAAQACVSRGPLDAVGGGGVGVVG
ncbi:MAG: phosphate starvation-inducible protein PhoH, partial [Frankia sp.]